VHEQPNQTRDASAKSTRSQLRKPKNEGFEEIEHGMFQILTPWEPRLRKQTGRDPYSEDSKSYIHTESMRGAQEKQVDGEPDKR